MSTLQILLSNAPRPLLLSVLAWLAARPRPEAEPRQPIEKPFPFFGE